MTFDNKGFGVTLLRAKHCPTLNVVNTILTDLLNFLVKVCLIFLENSKDGLPTKGILRITKFSEDSLSLKLILFSNNNNNNNFRVYTRFDT